MIAECAGGKNDFSASFGQVADLESICVVERSESVQSRCRAECCLYCQAFKVLMFGAAALSDMCVRGPSGATRSPVFPGWLGENDAERVCLHSGD